MPKPKGGRGHRAPYEAKLIRVPTPLADQVEQLKERYQDFLDQGGEPLQPPPLLDAIADDRPAGRYEHPEQAPVWHVGDLCACLLSSNGVIVPEVRIKSFSAKMQTCKVYDESTNSHWSASFNELIPLPVYKLLEQTFRQNQQLEEQGDKLVNELRKLEQHYSELHSEWIELKNNLWLEKKSKEVLEQQLKEVLEQQLAEVAKPINKFSEPVNTENKPVNELSETAIAHVDSSANSDDKPVNEFEDKVINELSETAIAHVDSSANSDDKPVNEFEDEDTNEPMTQSQLARFLGVSHTAVAKHKLLPDFGYWSSQRDPDGVAWRYDSKSKMFYPQDF